MRKQSPAEKVIEIFGGIRPISRIVGLAPASVWEWKNTRQKLVPTKYWSTLLKVASKENINLKLSDLMGFK